VPAAVLVAGLVAIALAFAAISATLLVRNLIQQPIKSAAVAASEVAIVGGAIAWVLTQLVNLIDITLAPMASLAEVGKQQAADWWNALVYGTVNTLYSQLLGTLIWYWANFQGFSYILSHFAGVEAYLDRVVGPIATATQNDLVGLHRWIDSYELPLIRGIGDDLAGLHHWIDGYELPLIRGIGDDLAGLHDWINTHVGLKADVANAEARAEAYAQALVVPITAAISDIENAPCMKFCSPLGDLGQLLQGLEDAGLLALLLLLLQEARTNPAGVAIAIDDTIGAVGRDAFQSLQLGIPE
jgi:hypothetical protein